MTLLFLILHNIALYLCLPLWALGALACIVAYLIVEGAKRVEILDKDGIRKSGRYAK